MIHKKNRPLIDLVDWEDRAGPKSKTQWQDGRSAKEAARHWLHEPTSTLPQDVVATLGSHKDFGPVIAWSGEPEVRLPIDGRRGEPRNTDLLLRCTDPFGSFVVAVEAKADESFGATLRSVRLSAENRLKVNSSSGAQDRLNELIASLLRTTPEEAATVDNLRYQLLTAAAGALRFAECEGITRAVLLVQEFVTDKTTDRKHETNQEDLDRWLSILSHGSHPKLADRSLVGPISVPGAPLLKGTAQLYVGKIRIDIRSSRRTVQPPATHA